MNWRKRYKGIHVGDKVRCIKRQDGAHPGTEGIVIWMDERWVQIQITKNIGTFSPYKDSKSGKYDTYGFNETRLETI